MTDIDEMITKIEDTDIFAKFKEEHSDTYLVHVFQHEKEGVDVIEVGYYLKDADQITVFTIDPVEKRGPEEVFKESGVLQPLDVSAVEVGLEDAKQLLDEFAKETYPAHPVKQKICILQHGPLWNVTLVTHTLHMITCKVDASSGEVVSHEIKNILSLRKES